MNQKFPGRGHPSNKRPDKTLHGSKREARRHVVQKKSSESREDLISPDFSQNISDVDIAIKTSELQLEYKKRREINVNLQEIQYRIERTLNRDSYVADQTVDVEPQKQQLKSLVTTLWGQELDKHNILKAIEDFLRCIPIEYSLDEDSRDLKFREEAASLSAQKISDAFRYTEELITGNMKLVWTRLKHEAGLDYASDDTSEDEFESDLEILRSPVAFNKNSAAFIQALNHMVPQMGSKLQRIKLKRLVKQYKTQVKVTEHWLQEMDQLQEESQGLKQEVKELENSLGSVNKAKEDVEQQKKRIGKIATELELDKNKLLKENEILEANVREKQQQIDRLQKQLREFENTKDEAHSLRKKIHHLENLPNPVHVCEDNSQIIDGLDSEIRSLKDQVELKQRTIVSLEEQLIAEKEKFSRMNCNMELANRRVQLERKSMEIRNSLMFNSGQGSHEKETEWEKIKQEHEKAMEEISRLNIMLKHRDKEVNNLKEQKASLRKEMLAMLAEARKPSALSVSSEIKDPRSSEILSCVFEFPASEGAEPAFSEESEITEGAVISKTSEGQRSLENSVNTNANTNQDQDVREGSISTTKKTLQGSATKTADVEQPREVAMNMNILREDSQETALPENSLHPRVVANNNDLSGGFVVQNVGKLPNVLDLNVKHENDAQRLRVGGVDLSEGERSRVSSETFPGTNEVVPRKKSFDELYNESVPRKISEMLSSGKQNAQQPEQEVIHEEEVCYEPVLDGATMKPVLCEVKGNYRQNCHEIQQSDGVDGLVRNEWPETIQDKARVVVQWVLQSAIQKLRGNDPNQSTDKGPVLENSKQQSVTRIAEPTDLEAPGLNGVRHKQKDKVDFVGSRSSAQGGGVSCGAGGGVSYGAGGKGAGAGVRCDADGGVSIGAGGKRAPGAGVGANFGTGGMGVPGIGGGASVGAGGMGAPGTGSGVEVVWNGTNVSVASCARVGGNGADAADTGDLSGPRVDSGAVSGGASNFGTPCTTTHSFGSSHRDSVEIEKPHNSSRVTAPARTFDGSAKRVIIRPVQETRALLPRKGEGQLWTESRNDQNDVLDTSQGQPHPVNVHGEIRPNVGKDVFRATFAKLQKASRKAPLNIREAGRLILGKDKNDPLDDLDIMIIQEATLQLFGKRVLPQMDGQQVKTIFQRQVRQGKGPLSQLDNNSSKPTWCSQGSEGSALTTDAGRRFVRSDIWNDVKPHQEELQLPVMEEMTLEETDLKEFCFLLLQNVHVRDSMSEIGEEEPDQPSQDSSIETAHGNSDSWASDGVHAECTALKSVTENDTTTRESVQNPRSQNATQPTSDVKVREKPTKAVDRNTNRVQTVNEKIIQKSVQKLTKPFDRKPNQIIAKYNSEDRSDTKQAPAVELQNTRQVFTGSGAAKIEIKATTTEASAREQWHLSDLAVMGLAMSVSGAAPDGDVVEIVQDEELIPGHQETSISKQLQRQDKKTISVSEETPVSKQLSRQETASDEVERLRAHVKHVVNLMEQDHKSQLQNMMLDFEREKNRLEANFHKQEQEHHSELHHIHDEILKLPIIFRCFRDVLAGTVKELGLSEVAKDLEKVPNIQLDENNLCPKKMLMDLVSQAATVLTSIETCTLEALWSLSTEAQELLPSSRVIQTNPKDVAHKKEAIVKDPKQKPTTNEFETLNKRAELLPAVQAMKRERLEEQCARLQKMYESSQRDFEQLKNDFVEVLSTKQKELDDVTTSHRQLQRLYRGQKDMTSRLQRKVNSRLATWDEHVSLCAHGLKENLKIVHRAFKENKISIITRNLTVDLITCLTQIPLLRLRSMLSRYIELKQYESVRVDFERELLSLPKEVTTELRQYARKIDGNLQWHTQQWQKRSNELVRAKEQAWREFVDRWEDTSTESKFRNITDDSRLLNRGDSAEPPPVETTSKASPTRRQIKIPQLEQTTQLVGNKVPLQGCNASTWDIQSSFSDRHSGRSASEASRWLSVPSPAHLQANPRHAAKAHPKKKFQGRTVLSLLPAEAYDFTGPVPRPISGVVHQSSCRPKSPLTNNFFERKSSSSANDRLSASDRNISESTQPCSGKTQKHMASRHQQ